MENTILTQPQKVEYILTKGCEYFGLDKSLLKKKFSRGEGRWAMKRYLIPVLYGHTISSEEDIANLLGYKNKSNVAYHIKKMKEELSDETYGSDKTKAIYKEFLAYLNMKEDE